VERRRIMENGSMDSDYCKGNSTIILSFEREMGKWSGWKELAGICEFGETDYVPSEIRESQKPHT
jgi:hypothetical protein